MLVFGDSATTVGLLIPSTWQIYFWDILVAVAVNAIILTLWHSKLLPHKILLGKGCPHMVQVGVSISKIPSVMLKRYTVAIFSHSRPHQQWNQRGAPCKLVTAAYHARSCLSAVTLGWIIPLGTCHRVFVQSCHPMMAFRNALSD